MRVLEKITANMELTELKKFKLQKAILALMLEWKHLEEYMDSTQHSFQECLDELQLKEKYLNSVQESAVESNKEMDSIRVLIEGRIKELDDKEREFQVFRDEQVNGLDLKEKQLGLIVNSIEERFNLVELREEKLAAKKKSVEGIFEEFKVEEKRFEDIRKSCEERIEEINSKGMQLEKRSKELDCVQDWIERRAKELDTKEVDIEKRCKELQSKEKELSDRVKEIEIMAKQIINVDSTKVETELQLEDTPVNRSIDKQFFIRMDGKGLQSFLNQQVRDHDSMAEEIYQALQLSSDPAKLVLDAMEGFYPTHPNKGNGEFKVDAVRKSCLLLLEQLLRISPQLQPYVKMEAMELLLQWKARISELPDSVEVLGLLFLLASYNLPMPFDADELSVLVEIVAEHRQTSELCRVLGLTDSIPDLIHNLIKRNRTLVAVRFVSEFGLDDKFPPAPLLKDYVKQVKTISKKMLKENKSRKMQNAVIDKRVAAMRDVIRCIKEYKLESKYSPEGIEQCIEHLLRQKTDNKGTAPPPPRKSVGQKKTKESMYFTNSPILSKLSTAPSSLKSAATKLGPVTDLAFILANMDGRSLQFFLNEHFEDHDLMRNEVLLALQHSSNPARLVLDGMQGFYLPSGKEGDERFEASVIRSSCILLLEQLMRLQICGQPQVKEAMVIAHIWNLKMRDEIENPQVILGFLQFIGAFGVASQFHSGELLCLFEKIAPHQHARELCQVLGFSKKNPGCILHPHVISEQSSSEIVPLNKAVDFLNVSLAHDSNSLGVNMEGKSDVPIFHYASDPAKLVLDAIRGCYRSNLEIWADHSNSKIMDKFSILLEQLMEASPEIKSPVQEEAIKFSVDWKAKLLVSRKNHAEVTTFLQLLATYKLASSVMFEELHGLFETVHDYKKLFKLYRLLGFAHKTPDYVQHLIENDQRLLAIRFIYEFELVEKFPPVTILKSLLRNIEKLSTKICEEGNYSPEALDKAADREIASLKAVIRCLSSYRVECDYTPENLQLLIDQLEKQKQDREVLVPTAVFMAKKKEFGMKRRASDLEDQPKQQGAKRPRVATPLTTANKPQQQDVKNLQAATHVTSALNTAPLALRVAYPVNPPQAPLQPPGLLTGQGKPYLAWEYDAYGAMTPLGWRYRPDASAYHHVATNVNPRPPMPQPSTPYLYRPWQQP